jgi:hypothetical protein
MCREVIGQILGSDVGGWARLSLHGLISIGTIRNLTSSSHCQSQGLILDEKGFSPVSAGRENEDSPNAPERAY